MRILRIQEEASMIAGVPDECRLLIACRMTIGWIEEWVNDGEVRDGLEFSSN